MSTVLCYGDSNTWGYRPDGSGRFGRLERWTGVLQASLGESCHVIEEGLSGRTSAFDDPFDRRLNGLSYLPVSLGTHLPLDAVVVLLGTNDLFLPGRLNANGVVRGVAALVDCIRTSACGPSDGEPAILVLVPPPFGPLGAFAADSPHGNEESERFSAAFATVAGENGFRILDLRGIATSSLIDGVHFDVESHAAIGTAVARELAGDLGVDLRSLVRDRGDTSEHGLDRSRTMDNQQ
jgi:lysophospholipase L1-like esterase